MNGNGKIRWGFLVATPLFGGLLLANLLAIQRGNDEQGADHEGLRESLTRTLARIEGRIELLSMIYSVEHPGSVVEPVMGNAPGTKGEDYVFKRSEQLGGSH
jgi:hypothetical protein